MRINRERLARSFTELCEIESPSRMEYGVSRYLQKQFSQLGADKIIVDESSAITGSETGNLIVTFKGNGSSAEPILFACHMDTVGPTAGIEVVRNGNIFTSKGETVLGADDKSGIAALIELVFVLKEHKSTHCPIELLFTTCEEIGLIGAKALDTYYSEISKFGIDFSRFAIVFFKLRGGNFQIRDGNFKMRDRNFKLRGENYKMRD